MLGTLLHRCPLAPSHRLQHLLWAIEALGCRVPYLSNHGLWSTVALGTGGYLLLVGREIHAPQILLEFAQVEVTQTAQVHGRSPERALISGTLPTPRLWTTNTRTPGPCMPRPSHFGEFGKGEFRRISLPRTRVNKGSSRLEWLAMKLTPVASLLAPQQLVSPRTAYATSPDQSGRRGLGR